MSAEEEQRPFQGDVWYDRQVASPIVDDEDENNNNGNNAAQPATPVVRQSAQRAPGAPGRVRRAPAARAPAEAIPMPSLVHDDSVNTHVAQRLAEYDAKTNILGNSRGKPARMVILDKLRVQMDTAAVALSTQHKLWKGLADMDVSECDPVPEYVDFCRRAVDADLAQEIQPGGDSATVRWCRSAAPDIGEALAYARSQEFRDFVKTVGALADATEKLLVNGAPFFRSLKAIHAAEAHYIRLSYPDSVETVHELVNIQGSRDTGVVVTGLVSREAERCVICMRHHVPCKLAKIDATCGTHAHCIDVPAERRCVCKNRYYHVDCIETWMLTQMQANANGQRGTARPSCPFCRGTFCYTDLTIITIERPAENDDDADDDDDANESVEQVGKRARTSVDIEELAAEAN